ncbi:hypothetical protein ACQ11C_003476, partial [Escherichia coli]
EAPDLLSRIACNSFYLYSDIATFWHGSGKMRFVHAGCHVNALPGLQKSLKFNILNYLCRPDKRSTSGSFAFVISL